MGRTPSGDGGGASWFGDDDPWVVGRLDDDFVNAAPIVEKSAAERVEELRQAAMSRQLLEDLAAEEFEQHRETAHRRRQRMLRGVATLVLVSLVVGAGLRLGGPHSWAPGEPSLELGDPEPTRRWDESSTPSPPVDQQVRPLGTPGAVPAAKGTYRYVSTQADARTPVAYDPCRSIHYVVNNQTAPDGAEDLLHDALDDVTAATGLRFVNDGATDERSSPERAAYQPGVYGDRWAPVLIAWTDEQEVDSLAGEVVGSAGSVELRRTASDGAGGTTDARLYVTGTVNLDGPDLATALDGDDGSDLVRAVILHELAHLVGLDHVADRGELMFPTAGQRTSFGPGDLHGLANLGRGACFADV